MLQRHEQLAFSGSIHFITTVARIRGTHFVTPSICRELLEIFESYRVKYDVACLGYVLMPDHFHVLMVQDKDDLTIPPLMQSFKKLTAQRLWRARGKTGTLWHYRYDDVPVPGTKAIQTKLKYIHENPLRAGLVEQPEDYPWSSAKDLYYETKGIVTVVKT
jgi:putative transposase